ncbi:XTP/dITP diphosphatase [Companilactobacillus metriopterae]|uniref:XTP/dITP diphosphatase n=1 Tax=Companilactobacillus metriopterae TaxID=1909267 RepID=UPI00100BDBDC|nr:XTP/dITP diphosphatase [Companilactobacillus metriopterae]
MPEIIVATKNPNKAKEFQKIFEDTQYEVKTLFDFPDAPNIIENGTTFEENAKLKAHTISEKYNVPVIADDSGLCVDALHGKPGVYSARFAGDHNDAANNAKLLSELGGVALQDRTATFMTTLVFTDPEKSDDLVVTGELKGLIAIFPNGDNGFGYDPLFYVPELEKTLAQLSMDEKNEISHRGRAISELEKSWQDWLNK